MRVLHLFDRYLNHTMNWAYRLLKYGPPRPLVAAPLLVKNEFLHPDFEFLPPLWPQTFPSEWHISPWQQAITSLGWKSTHFYQRLLKKRLQQKPPDLLHAHFAQVGWYFLPLAKALHKPLLVSFYGYDYERLPTLQPRWKSRYRQLFAEANGFLVEGNHGKSILLQMGCPEHKIHLLPLGISLQKAGEPRKKMPGELRILQAATFTEKKGQYDSLRAFHKALPNAPNMQLTFVGEIADKELYQKLQAYVEAHRLEGRVRFLDFVPFGKFQRFLQAFHLFLQPSRYAPDRDCEGGAPVALLDAQQAGLPVVSTRHCDIPSRVLHGQTALLCEEGDIACLADALLQFYHMKNETYQRFSRHARVFVQLHFDARKTGERLKALYARYA